MRLTLNIEAEDYLGTVNPVQGAKMVVHDPSEVPFPSDSGLDLSPLTETVVALKRVNEISDIDQWHSAYFITSLSAIARATKTLLYWKIPCFMVNIDFFLLLNDLFSNLTDSCSARASTTRALRPRAGRQVEGSL
jgi:hypothetical protein